MPGWITEVLLAILGSTTVAGGVGWIFKTRRDDRIARELAYVNEIKMLQAEVKSLQAEVKELLQDRIRYEMVRRESSDQTNKLLTDSMTLLRELTKTVTLLRGGDTQ